MNLDAFQPAAARPIRSHRSYRTLPLGKTTMIVSIALFVLVEIVLIAIIPSFTKWMTVFDQHILTDGGFAIGLGTDTFLGIQLTPLSFSMPTHHFIELLTWMFGCALAVLIISIFRIVPLPWRYFVNLNLMIVTAEATYLFFAGHLGYASNEFSVLMLRTAIVTWLVMPLFLLIISSLFPFTILDQFLLFIVGMVVELSITTLRYAVFAAILVKTGPILMADLYLLYGPLMDVIPLVAVYTYFLVRIAKRLERGTVEWAWL
jgi:hypothetical protein